MDYGKVRLDVGHDSVGVITIQNPPVNSLAPDGKNLLDFLPCLTRRRKEPCCAGSSHALNGSSQGICRLTAASEALGVRLVNLGACELA